MKLSAWSWTAAICALSASASAATPDSIRELYAEGKFVAVIAQAPSAAAQIKESLEAEQLLQIAEDTAVLRLHQLSGLGAVYSALAKHPWPSGLATRLKASQKIASEGARIDGMKEPSALVAIAEKLFEQARILKRGILPNPEAEPPLVFAVGASLRALDAKPSPAQRASALGILSRALPRVFPGTQRPYQESFLTEFPGDPLAPRVLELLQNELEEFYRSAGEPAEIPEKEQNLLKSLEAKIKAASKPGK
jgi:hypothetical protein